MNFSQISCQQLEWEMSEWKEQGYTEGEEGIIGSASDEGDLEYCSSSLFFSLRGYSTL